MKPYGLDEFINGMTQGFLAPRGYFKTAEAATQTETMAALGINFTALVVNQFQETFGSTRIFPDNARTVSDDELRLQIDRLHKHGIRVMLKPMLEPLDSLWRGHIRHASGNILADVVTDNAALWFASYREFLRRYAEIATETGCEMFCIGCELDGMEIHRQHWSNCIRLVRSLYPGVITYNLTMNITDFSECRRWLSELDLVGVSGYFKVGPKDRSIPLSQMVENWQPWRDKLEAFAQWLQKPLFFAETGARPQVGAAGITGDYNDGLAVYSERDQSDYYLSTVTTFRNEPWFYGTVWGKWDGHQYRPNYHLSDGHYIGCEPAPEMRHTMKTWCAGGKIPRPELRPVLSPVNRSDA